MIQGQHEPRVSVGSWERVPGVLDGHFAKQHSRLLNLVGSNCSWDEGGCARHLAPTP